VSGLRIGRHLTTPTSTRPPVCALCFALRKGLGLSSFLPASTSNSLLYTSCNAGLLLIVLRVETAGAGSGTSLECAAYELLLKEAISFVCECNGIGIQGEYINSG